MSHEDPLIRYLFTLRYENTGMLAALRRACGQRLAESRDCQRFVSISTCPADFLTATLAAQYSAAQIQSGKHHKQYANGGSIGAAWAQYCRDHPPKKDPAAFYRDRQDALANGQEPPHLPSIHERFRTLLDAELERDGTGELAHRLRSVVRMLVAADIPIDVIQLAYDLRAWRANSRYVQLRWAKAFYGSPLGGNNAKDAFDEPEETEELEAQDQEEDNDVD